MAAKDNEQVKPEDAENSGSVSDMSQAAVKKMMGTARVRGYITYDELNQVLPPDQVSSEQIEDVMSMLSDMGVNIIEAEEVEDDSSKDLTWLTPTPNNWRLRKPARRRWTGPMIRCACTCARWARWNCCRARAK